MKGKMIVRRLRTVLILAIALWWSSPAAWPCSVPVFRYALERWQGEPFQVVVFHKGAPDRATSAFVNTLNEAAEGAPNRANVHAVAVSVDKEIPEEFRALWAQAKTENLPRAVALFANSPCVAWEGKPTLDNARRLLDSPARTKIANYIMDGASTVWVLLECGDKQIMQIMCRSCGCHI